ncbi:MAG: hypothetical protein CL843_07480 [Crocinitomicaceae bacterium]|nr:hypothetical protein [Crocinitomicaceae bacterium]|tara:strand:+ start:318 stop:902 length:585 start_codon:yes stop_codon:yes gene_type:complete
MKQLTSLLLLLFALINGLTAQTKPLKSSIGCIGDMGTNPYGREFFEDDEINSYPQDLKDQKAFFIEINEWDMGFNAPFNAKKHWYFNITLINKLNKKYPYSFTSFTNDYVDKDIQWFIDQGFRYRILIQVREHGHLSYSPSMISSRYTISSDTHSLYVIAIEDIITGDIYSSNRVFGRKSYLRKFIKKVKKMYK